VQIWPSDFQQSQLLKITDTINDTSNAKKKTLDLKPYTLGKKKLTQDAS